MKADHIVEALTADGETWSRRWTARTFLRSGCRQRMSAASLKRRRKRSRSCGRRRPRWCMDGGLNAELPMLWEELVLNVPLAVKVCNT